jgi:hypothetical protein
MVKCRNSIGGHQQQVIADRIQVAHFAPAQEGRCAKIRRKESFHWKALPRWELKLRFSKQGLALSIFAD